MEKPFLAIKRTFEVSVTPSFSLVDDYVTSHFSFVEKVLLK